MKTVLLYVLFSAVILVQKPYAQTASPYQVCINRATFSYPKKHQRVVAGRTMYIGVKPTNPSDIAFMELYLNGIFIGRDHSLPFLWGRERTSKLRKIESGNYRLECRIKDRCGTTHSIYKTILVKPTLIPTVTGRHLQNQPK